MNTHLAQYPGRFKYNGSLDRGDIIVIRWHTQDSPADFHVRVTVGYGNSEEFVQGGQYGRAGVFGLLADQHVTDRKRVIWNDGFSPDTNWWPWQVIW